ncbi:MAG: matrixin family metalloprotease, partial [Acidobacteriota bacterium]|nr:matrixin family metalloprotease [Acidobacteriota bacterium]
SPIDSKPPVNIVLFGDPYDDITDPSGCGGVLAMGGYWRTSSPTKTINGRTFYPATRLYTVFNNNFECWLGDPESLAEVATHELGHGLGFGHSGVSDAIMRAYAYGGRGPRLGDDDRDAAHCHYPHGFGLVAPDAGESWAVGTVHEILWSATPESGDDPGTVTIELSTDNGQSWSPIAVDEINDGAFLWTVPDAPTGQAKIRVTRPNLVSPTPAPYPSACSGATSAGSFAIAAPLPGTVPDGFAGAPLTVDRGDNGEIVLSWDPSCSGDAQDYAVYEGSLDALRTGVWDHVPVSCSAGTDLNESIVPGIGARYYLIAPLAGSAEGTLGRSSAGLDRPVGTVSCGTREPASCDPAGSGEEYSGESPFAHFDQP